MGGQDEFGEMQQVGMARGRLWDPLCQGRRRSAWASHKAITIACPAAGQGDIPAGAGTGAQIQHRVRGDTWLLGRGFFCLSFVCIWAAFPPSLCPRRGFLILT